MPGPFISPALAAFACLASALAAGTAIPSVPTDQAVVALTFDDGPHSPNTTRLLELFEREKVRVTFFEIADNITLHPALARAIVAAGHEIGNHTKTHANLSELKDPEAVRAELVEAQVIIREVTGVTPVVFRAPFLAHSPGLWAVLEELQMPSITSDASTSDWDGTVTKEMIIERASRAGPGSIVLLHTWPDKTIDAMPEIIARLRAKGLRFVTVSELLALAPQPPKP